MPTLCYSPQVLLTLFSPVRCYHPPQGRLLFTPQSPKQLKLPSAQSSFLCVTLVPFRCAFFHGEVDKPAQGFLHRGGRKPVTVAISLEGVHVIDSKEKVPPQASPSRWD